MAVLSRGHALGRRFDNTSATWHHEDTCAFAMGGSEVELTERRAKTDLT